MQKRYPLHFYLQFLKFASDALRELSFDTLKVIKIARLPVNSYNAIELPCNYVDLVALGVEWGAYVQPLVASDAINRLPHYNNEGQITKYPDVSYDDSKSGNIFGVGFLGYNWVTWNEYNEPTGRLYGLGNFPGANGYKIIIERNIIQLDDASCSKWAVLSWISDGQDCDSATMVDTYAIKTIESYIVWQLKLHSRAYSDGQAAEAERIFINDHKNLRARKNDLTCADIRNIIRKQSHASIKT